MKTEETSLLNPAKAALTVLPLAGLLLALPSAGGAQTTCRIYCPDGTSFIQECTSNVDPCRSSGPGGGFIPQPPADPGPAQRERFRAVLGRGVLDASFAAMPTASDDDFSRALGAAYDRLARIAVVAKAERQYHVAKSAAEQTAYEDFYVPRFARVDAADGLDPAVKAENLQARQEHETLTAEFQRVWAIREAFWNPMYAPHQALRLHKEAAQEAKKRINVYLGEFTREEAEDYSGYASVSIPRTDCCAAQPFPIPLYYAMGPTTRIEHLQAVADATERLQEARTKAIPAVGGSIAARLEFVEGAVENAAAESKAAGEWRRHYQQTVHPRTLSGDRNWKRIAAANVGAMTQTHELVTQGIPKAKVMATWARDVFKTDASAFLANGAKAGTWKVFRKHMLEPELRRIGVELFGGRYRFSDAEVEQAWKQSKGPIFGAWRRNYSRATEADAVVKVAQKLEKGFESAALAAAEVLGQAEAAEIQEAGDQLFKGIHADARAEVEAVLQETDMPAWARKYWEAYFTGAKPSI